MEAAQTPSTKAWQFLCRIARMLVVLYTLGAGGHSQARSHAFTEYEVKAAFLLNFVQFVKWPARALPEAGSPFCIGILGEDPFGGALEKATQGETISGRKLIIKRSHHVEELKNCQVVFISKSERSNLVDILGTAGLAGALTVSEVGQFARQGGMIELTMQGSKVGFEINVEAVHRAGLQISSKLLKLGKVVGSG